MDKLDLAKQVTNLDDLKSHMKPGDIMFQGRIRTFEGGIGPNIMSGLMQLGQKTDIMHAAMVGHKNKILDYGTGGIAHMKGKVKRGFKRLDLKDMIKGDRILAIGRVVGKDIEEKKDYIKKFEEMAKERIFDVSKSLKVGFNKFVGKDIFAVPKEGDFCSTIIDKSIKGLNIEGEATPADLLNSKKVEIVAVYDPELNKKAEFAPGLPSKERYDTIQHKPGDTRIVFQRHKAHADHYDMRLQQGDVAHSWVTRSLPGEKDKFLAIRQPTHTADYMNFEGTISKGYGKGTVKKAYDEPAEIIESSENRIKFVIPEGEHTMIKLKDKNWLVVKNKHTIPDPITEKMEMKDVSKREVNFDDPSIVLEPKVDGSHSLFRLRSDGINRIYSYRTSKRNNKPIEHTHQVPILRDAKVPKEFDGVELRGELYAKSRDGKPLGAEEIGGILNSGIRNSREKQSIEGALVAYPYRIVKWKGGKNVEGAPYSEHIKMLSELSKKVPEFPMPEIADTPEKKKDLLNQIKNKQHPDTQEGVVQYDLTAPGGEPKKIKLRDTHEVVIRDIFPAKTKSGREFAGGFTYSWKPDSQVVGRVGTGFNQAMREDMLKNPKKYIGSVARIKTQQVFQSGAARAPSFYTMHLEKNLEKNAFRFNKNVLIGAAALTPITAYTIHNNKKLLPKGTFRGEYARSVAVDVGADATLTGMGAAIGKGFGRPGIGAAAGMASAYFIPAFINTKRMMKNQGAI